MSAPPREATDIHTRLLHCTLEVEESREYWRRAAGAEAPPSANQVFGESWFGPKSLERVKKVLSSLRARYNAFPPCLPVLAGWRGMDPDTRRLICHWHLQFSDPLYRAFTGVFLPARHAESRPSVTHAVTVGWVGEQVADRWNTATRVQFASKLLSAAHSAGLVASRRDPRSLTFPRVGDLPLTYLLYLLRGVQFEGTLTENPYLASVGLADPQLEARLWALGALRFRRQGDLIEFGWWYEDLLSWAAATVFETARASVGGLL